MPVIKDTTVKPSDICLQAKALITEEAVYAYEHTINRTISRTKSRLANQLADKILETPRFFTSYTEGEYIAIEVNLIVMTYEEYNHLVATKFKEGVDSVSGLDRTPDIFKDW